MIGFELDTREVEAVVDRAATALDARRIATAIGFRLVAWVDENFQDEGREPKWAPLKASTLARRRKAGAGAKILQDTGRMKQSFVPGGRDGAYFIGPDYVSVGTKVAYAPTHELGSLERKIPARPMLPRLATAETLAGETTVAALEVIARG